MAKSLPFSACRKKVKRGKVESRRDSEMTMDEVVEGCHCGAHGAANLLQIGSIVGDIIEHPCLVNSPIKVQGNKMLKPEKWHAIFDRDGRVSCFSKALKLIVLGGVDPSIRAEVWEFLLGCYELGSTTEHRRQLRMARRERYRDLIKQCQAMHSSIGTGTLAYSIGSKVMDVRTVSKDNFHHEVEPVSMFSHQEINNDKEASSDVKYSQSDSQDACKRSDVADLASVSGSRDSVSSAPSGAFVTSAPNYHFASKSWHGSQYPADSHFYFPSLPVTNLFGNNDDDDLAPPELRLGLEDQRMRSFRIDNNIDLIMESNNRQSVDVSSESYANSEMCNFYSIEASAKESLNFEHGLKTTNRLRISNVAESAMTSVASHVATGDEERVSEWLWTLHRIVVDVVRTDSHLEFYEDAKNIARMSDILAVYAWVDPATGYCQGMSDLLSPFVVLYEDNADAFWCFEMLLRRMRNNFQMEGPTGVMKQLQSLWRILELTDAEMFSHLSLIGAESLHFAFRMLLVLFRRELSFNESLLLWEMMWAADFDEAVTRELEESCLEPLIFHHSVVSSSERINDDVENNGINSEDTQASDGGNACVSLTTNSGIKSASIYPLCGLASMNFWCSSDNMQGRTVISTINAKDELVVFCVAAVLFINRHRVIKGSHSIDDLIKIFNDKLLNINVKRCVRMAMKLRKKYFYKIIKSTAQRQLVKIYD